MTWSISAPQNTSTIINHFIFVHGVFYRRVTFFSFVFQAWPEDALEMVANKFLDDVEMSREVRGECVSLCKHFHQSVRGISER